MKNQFLIIGLTEGTIVTSACLSSSGISIEEEFLIQENHLQTVDTEAEAIERVGEILNETGNEFEHGITIRKIWVK